MPNHTGLSPQSPNKYLGPDVYISTVVTRNREPTGADYRQPETGKLYPFGSFWLVGKNPTSGNFGEMWYLSKIVANVAYWVRITPQGFVPVVGVVNIGFSYDVGTGTFTVHGQDGSALSINNPAFVTLQDKSDPGQLVTIPIIANQDFVDSNGTSEIIGNLFGLTTGVAVSVDIPFYLYAVSNDSEDAVAFMISRFPNATTAPVAAKIGTPSSAVASTQGSFFAMDSITVGDYDLNPCVAIGSFRMMMNASDDWTVQTLASRDGVGHFQEGIQFGFPRGQFGAASGKIFKDNGGTAPDDPAGGYGYYIDQQNNRVFYQVAFPNIIIAGLGAVNARVALPFIRLEGATSASGFINIGGSYTLVVGSTAPSTNDLGFIFVNDTANGLVTNALFVPGTVISFNGTMAISFE